MRVFLSIVSCLISLLFFTLGITQMMHYGVSAFLGISLGITAYSILMLVSLIWALKGGSLDAVKLAKYTVITNITHFTLANFDVGMVSGLELVLIIFYSSFHIGNWLAIRKVVMLRKILN